MVNAFGMLAASTAILLPVTLLVEGPPAIELGLATWASLFALASLSTVFAYLLYFEILARAGSANLMLVTILIPPIAMILGALFLDEVVGVEDLLGFGLIAAGLLIMDGRLWRCIVSNLGGVRP